MRADKIVDTRRCSHQSDLDLATGVDLSKRSCVASFACVDVVVRTLDGRFGGVIPKMKQISEFSKIVRTAQKGSGISV